MLQKVIQPCFEALFPRECVACQRLLIPQERYLCAICELELPKCPDIPYGMETVKQVFSHRLPIVQMHSWLSYREGGLGGHLMKGIKYGGLESLGEYLGSRFALDWITLNTLIPPDIIVPIPITRRKRKKRGYNQSEAIARGWSSVAQIPLKPELLKRKHQTLQQTHLSRWERFSNVEKAFEWDFETCAQHKHILIFDDTTTTGATLEAAARPLIARGHSISFATLAYVE